MKEDQTQLKSKTDTSQESAPREASGGLISPDYKTPTDKVLSDQKSAPLDVAREYEWREYSLHIDLYKFYFDLALKANVFFYVVAGSILGFYLTHSNVSHIKLSLLLPILLGVVLGGVFIWGAILWSAVTNNIRRIRKELKRQGLDVEKTPDVQLLFWLLLIFGIIFWAVSIAIIVLWRLT